MTDSPLTRASLLLRLRDHTDSDAWNSFLNDYGPMLYRFVRSRGLQDADASDVVQDVMRSVGLAINRLEYHKEKGGFRAWLFAITRNKLATHFDKQKRHGRNTGYPAPLELSDREVEPTVSMDQQWELEHQRQLVELAIANVKPKIEATTWMAFELTAIQALPAEEASKLTGLSVGAVYVARSRVTAKLRVEIERLQEEDLL